MFWCLITQTNTLNWNKREYIGCLESTIEDNMIDDTHTQGQPNTQQIVSTLQKMMAEQEQPDTFHPSHHKLKPNIESET